MAQPKKFPMGVGPPVVLGIPIKSTSVDLTTVTAVALYPERPDGTQPTGTPWSATLVAAPGEQAVTATRALVQHPFQTSDLDMVGQWNFQIVLTIPTGTWPGDPEETPALICTDRWGNT